MAISLSLSYAKLQSIIGSKSNDVLPSLSALGHAEKSLPSSLPEAGLGEPATEAHLVSEITLGLSGQKTSSNYYGFVTGGVLPIAEIADNIVTAFDNSCQVHLPDQSISTTVEDRALSMLTELLNLGDGWNGRTFTTGATGANVLGLACGREAVVKARQKRAGESGGVGELGLLGACMAAGIKEIQVLTAMGHSSLYKAASIVGLGRASIKDIALHKGQPWKLDVDALENKLKASDEGVASIVVLSMGELLEPSLDRCHQLQSSLRLSTLPPELNSPTPLRATGTKCSTWFASSLPTQTMLMPQPYDCGFFFTRSSDTLPAIFHNPNAAYLSGGSSAIASPLNIGLENSRRFRALPVYAVLLAYGREGFAEMFARQVRLARGIAEFLSGSEDFELLPSQPSSDGNYADVHIIVIFRARDEAVNAELVKRVNGTNKIYVSGTKWDGKPACRIAVSTWRVDVERDLDLVKKVLRAASKPNV
ncbi:hypothetical protein JHW43_007878 [Diplocarpon mali]|nr:hypothetical protein JHW43_007878 [Diplocarpon mali]